MSHPLVWYAKQASAQWVRLSVEIFFINPAILLASFVHKTFVLVSVKLKWSNSFLRQRPDRRALFLLYLPLSLLFFLPFLFLFLCLCPCPFLSLFPFLFLFLFPFLFLCPYPFLSLFLFLFLYLVFFLFLFLLIFLFFFLLLSRELWLWGCGMCVCTYLCMYVCVCLSVCLHACMHACMYVLSSVNKPNHSLLYITVHYTHLLAPMSDTCQSPLCDRNCHHCCDASHEEGKQHKADQKPNNSKRFGDYRLRCSVSITW